MNTVFSRRHLLCFCLAVMLAFSAVLSGCDKKTEADVTPTPAGTDTAVSESAAAPVAATPAAATPEPTEQPSVTPPAAYPADAASESDVHLITELPASMSDAVVMLPATDSDLH